MSVASPAENRSVASGLGAWWGLLGPGASYYDGDTWRASNDMNWLAFAAQDADTVNGVTFLVCYWANVSVEDQGAGVMVSTDLGVNWTPYDWRVLNGEYSEQARYGSFISDQIGFLSGGHWPASAENLLIGSDDDLYRFSQHIRLRLPGQDYLPNEAREVYQSRTAAENGYRAVVAKTVDGGKTWSVLYDLNGGEYYFNAIHFVNETSGCVVGEGTYGAHIFCTVDGGATFVEKWTSTGASLLAIDFSDSLNGWAGGMYIPESNPPTGPTALLLQTTDGGNTWLPVDASFAPGHIIASISMTTATIGSAVALNLASVSSILRYD